MWPASLWLEGLPAPDLGRDGHPARGGFLPLVPLPNRMWAGGLVEFEAPLPLGAAAEKRSRIASVTHKAGRSGELAFVTVAHELWHEGAMALRELQEIVYKSAASVGAAAATARQASPGYNGTNAINPSLYKKLAWDPVTSFLPISLVARVNNVVVVTPALPVNTLPDLTRYAKAHPGEVNYGSAGAGSIFHLGGEMYAQLAGVKVTHVPYKGAAPALTDLMGGQTQFMVASMPAALPFIRSGKLRAIAVTGAQRSPLFPALPTALETGYPSMVVDSWFGIFAPSGVPEDVRMRLNSAIRKVLINPAYVRKLEEQGAQPTPSSPAELARLLADDIKSWRAIVRGARISLE